MGAVAASLAVVSALHLAGLVSGGSGVAEAVIGAVLLAGAVEMVRSPRQARAIGLAASGFAVIGFIIGLGLNAGGGHTPDIAYDAIVLPILVWTWLTLLRSPSWQPSSEIP